MATTNNFKPFNGNPDYFEIRVYDKSKRVFVNSKQVWDTIDETMSQKMENACLHHYGFLDKYKNRPNTQVSIIPYDTNGNPMVEITNDITKAEMNRVFSVVNTDLLNKTKLSPYEVIMELVKETEATELIVSKYATEFKFYADTKNNRVFIANSSLGASNLIYIFPTPSQFLSNYKFWYKALDDNEAESTLRHWINNNKGDEYIGEVSPSRWEYNLDMMRYVLLPYCDHFIDKVYEEIRYFNPKLPNEVLFTTYF